MRALVYGLLFGLCVAWWSTTADRRWDKRYAEYLWRER